MNTVIQKQHFFRLKAAMADLIDRAGGIERAADLCGYSKSAVGRWHCRNNDDLMPMAAIVAMECETGSHFVTQAMCGIHGMSAAPVANDAVQFLGAYVAVSQHHSDLQAAVAGALSDGIITGTEQQKIEAKAARAAEDIEALRGTLAAAGGTPLKVVGI
jgi:hypothetical protein